MVTSEKHQKALMGGIEALVGVDHPDLIPAIPKFLAQFYQADVLDEEFIKSWGTHVSKKYVDRDISKKVRKASEPFLKVRSMLSFICCIWGPMLTRGCCLMLPSGWMRPKRTNPMMNENQLLFDQVACSMHTCFLVS